MKKPMFLLLFFAVIAIVLAPGCTQSAPAPAQAPARTTAPVAPPSADTVKTAQSTLGMVLTDAKGMTLYFFADDIPGNGISTCYGTCVKFWPVFSTASPVVSAREIYPALPAKFPAGEFPGLR